MQKIILNSLLLATAFCLNPLKATKSVKPKKGTTSYSDKQLGTAKTKSPATSSLPREKRSQIIKDICLYLTFFICIVNLILNFVILKAKKNADEIEEEKSFSLLNEAYQGPTSPRMSSTGFLQQINNRSHRNTNGSRKNFRGPRSFVNGSRGFIDKGQNSINDRSNIDNVTQSDDDFNFGVFNQDLSDS